MNNQIAKIVAYCNKNTWITQREALKLGIYRLASRISEMKFCGYYIETEYIVVRNSDGTSSRIARYRIVKTPDEVMTNAMETN